jgi:hypothetical protein
MAEPEGSRLVLYCSRPSGIIAGDRCGKSAYGSEDVDVMRAAGVLFSRSGRLRAVA